MLSVLTVATLVLSADRVSARRGGNCCACSCYTPCCPNPWWPSFRFHAYLDKPSPYIPPDPNYRLPVVVTVTNWECYEWAYSNAEYQYYLFDQWGNLIPNAFTVTLEQRTILVPPCVSIMDRPGVFLKADNLNLGQYYTVVVCLRGHCCSFTVIPVLESKKGKTAAQAAANIVVTLPADAKLTIDGEATTSTSGTRVFTTPPLPGGQDYHYTLKAEVVRDGVVQAVTKEVSVRAGEETRVQLEIPMLTAPAR